MFGDKVKRCGVVKIDVKADGGTKKAKVTMVCGVEESELAPFSLTREPWKFAKTIDGKALGRFTLGISEVVYPPDPEPADDEQGEELPDGEAMPEDGAADAEPVREAEVVGAVLAEEPEEPEGMEEAEPCDDKAGDAPSTEPSWGFFLDEVALDKPKLRELAPGYYGFTFTIEMPLDEADEESEDRFLWLLYRLGQYVDVKFTKAPERDLFSDPDEKPAEATDEAAEAVEEAPAEATDEAAEAVEEAPAETPDEVGNGGLIRCRQCYGQRKASSIEDGLCKACRNRGEH